MADVANAAGVSKTTASHILNKRQPFYSQFSEETKKRVLREAKRLGYRPNILAVGLKRGRSSLFALMVEDQWQEEPPLTWGPAVLGFEMSLLSGICRQATEEGLYPVLALHRNGADEEVTTAKRLMSSGVGGGIFRSPTPELMEYLLEEVIGHVPAVVVFPKSRRNLPTNWVDGDSRQAGWMAADRLVSLGKQRIVTVARVGVVEAEEERIEGCQERLARENLELVARLEFPESARIDDMLPDIRQGLKETGADGAVATCATTSLATVMAAQELGLSFPDDLAVAGHDAYHIKPPWIPRVTSVEVPWFEAGMCATRMLAEMHRSGTFTCEPVALPPTLLVGET